MVAFLPWQQSVMALYVLNTSTRGRPGEEAAKDQSVALREMYTSGNTPLHGKSDRSPHFFRDTGETWEITLKGLAKSL